MTTEVSIFKGAAVPAFAKSAEMSPLAKALAGGVSTGKRISIKGGTFRLVVDGEEVSRIEERYLDVVIVNSASKVGRTFYGVKYKEGEETSPVCWSVDGDTPDASINQPQSKTCASCDQNVKGSGDNDTRACRFSQRLAVVLANDPEGLVLQLSVPSKSLFGKAESTSPDKVPSMPMQAYGKYLATQHINPDMVITRLKFDTNESSPKLFFKPMRWLEPDEYAIVQQQGKSADALQAINMSVAALDKPQRALAAPAAVEDDDAPPPAPKAAKKAAKPAAVEDDDAPPPAPKAAKKAAKPPVDDDDDAPPPAKRPTKEAPAAGPANSSLASLVNQWDE